MTDTQGDATMVHGRRSIARNSAFLVAAQIATGLLGLATTLAISRALGPVALGEWRFAIAVSAYLVVISDAGLSIYAVREIAKDAAAAPRLGVPVILVQTVIATVLYLLLVAALLVSELSTTTVVVTAVLCLTGLVRALSIAHVLQAYERMDILAYFVLATQLAGTVGGLVLLVLTRELVWLALAQVVAGAVADALLLRMAVRAFTLPLLAPQMREALRLLANAFPFLMAGIATQIIFNADALLIAILRDAHDLGVYAAGYILASQLLVASGPIMVAAYPRLSTEGAAGSASLAAALAAVLGFVILPLAIGGAAVADQLVALLYGPRFHASALIALIAMSLPAIGVYNAILAQALYARDRERTVMRVAAATATFNIAANLVLLPLVGIVGSAVAVLLSEGVTATLFTLTSKTLLSLAPLRGYGINVLRALLMAAVVVAARAEWSPSLALDVAIAATAYLASALLVPDRGARLAARTLAAAVRRAGGGRTTGAA